MSIIVFITLVVAIVLGSSEDLIKRINDANLSWKAAKNKFTDWSVERMRKLMGVQGFTERITKDWKAKLENLDESEYSDLPVSFDWRNVSGECVHPIRDQGDCGSCYAFGTTESFSDRLCLFSQGKVDVVLSPQNLIDCELLNLGCDGGVPLLCWKHLVREGVSSDSCVPYEGSKSKCEKHCTHNTSQPFTKYYSESAKLVEGTENIMKDLMKNGPQTVGFLVFEDFMYYDSGVYVHHSGRFVGAHAVKFIGWGETEQGEKYWIVANSWNTDWGLDGYFLIKRGVKPLGECGIEAEVVSGIPKV